MGISITGSKGAASEPLWRPSPQRVAECQLTAFRAEANRRHGLKLEDFRALHAWSVAHSADFWELVWDFCGIVGEKGERALLPRCQAQFCREPALQARPGRRADLSRRDQSQFKDLVGGIGRAGFTPATGAACTRRWTRRSRGSDDAEPAGDGRAHARRHLARRNLFVLLARFRRDRRP